MRGTLLYFLRNGEEGKHVGVGAHMGKYNGSEEQVGLYSSR